MNDKEQQREYRTVGYLCSTLANVCDAPPDMVIDALTGLLWDEEEAGQIKTANMPEQPHHETAHGEFAIEVANRAVAEERERCAKLCEWLPIGTGLQGKTFAEAIRGEGMGGKMAQGFSA